MQRAVLSHAITRNCFTQPFHPSGLRFRVRFLGFDCSGGISHCHWWGPRPHERLANAAVSANVRKVHMGMHHAVFLDIQREVSKPCSIVPIGCIYLQ